MRLALVALFVLSLGCYRPEDVALCEASTSHWNAAYGPATPEAMKAEQARCLKAVDSLKTGMRTCVGSCYSKITDREGLLDCDRLCQVKVQAPKPE